MKKQLYKIYYLLASLDLLTILITIGIAYSIQKIHLQTLQNSDIWAKRQAEHIEVIRLIIEANGPGNDVFKTKKYEYELQKFNNIYKELRLKLKHLENGSTSYIQDSDNINNYAKIKNHLNQAKGYTEKIISSLKENKTTEATHLMSLMDDSFHQALKIFTKLQQILNDTQKASLKLSHQEAEKLYKFEMLAACIIILIIGAVLLFGQKLKNNFQEADNELTERNKEIETLVDALNNHIIMAKTNLNGVIVEANEKFCEISGYSKDELIGKNQNIVNSGFHDKSFFKELWKTIKAGKVWKNTIVNRKKNGELYYVDTTITPVYKNNKITHYLSLRTDITSNINKEHEKISELNRILSSTPSCLKIVSQEGLLEDMNKQGLDLIGAESLEQVKHANVFELVTVEHRDKFINFHQKVCEGHPGSLIFEIEGLKGVRRWMETYAAQYELSNGEKAQIAITNDISARVSAEKELEKQKRIASQSSKLASIGELAAGVGHEINNPLAIIKGYVQSIQKKLSNNKEIKNEEMLELLSRIIIASDRIANIVGGLRNFARSDSNSIVSFSLNDLMNETILMISDIYKHESINISYNEKVDDIYVYMQRGRLQQVIVNMLQNAKDALSGIQNKSIVIEIDSVDSFAEIRIQDNGSGISDEVKEKIFDPFFTTKEINQGTGIGLSLVNQYINEAHGHIEVSSSPGHGTTFTIFIPVSEIPIAKNNKANEDKIIELNKNKISTKRFLGKKALIVDDEPELTNILSDILSSEGMTCTTSNDPIEALEIATTKNFDVIISDIKMPEMDGVTLGEKIFASPNCKNVCYFLITGGVNIEKSHHFANKICGYLYKPFENDQVLEVLINKMNELKLKQTS